MDNLLNQLLPKSKKTDTSKKVHPAITRERKQKNPSSDRVEMAKLQLRKIVSRCSSRILSDLLAEHGVEKYSFKRKSALIGQATKILCEGLGVE